MPADVLELLSDLHWGLQASGSGALMYLRGMYCLSQQGDNPLKRIWKCKENGMFLYYTWNSDWEKISGWGFGTDCTASPDVVAHVDVDDPTEIHEWRFDGFKRYRMDLSIVYVFEGKIHPVPRGLRGLQALINSLDAEIRTALTRGRKALQAKLDQEAKAVKHLKEQLKDRDAKLEDLTAEKKVLQVKLDKEVEQVKDLKEQLSDRDGKLEELATSKVEFEQNLQAASTHHVQQGFVLMKAMDEASHWRRAYAVAASSAFALHGKLLTATNRFPLVAERFPALASGLDRIVAQKEQLDGLLTDDYGASAENAKVFVREQIQAWLPLEPADAQMKANANSLHCLHTSIVAMIDAQPGLFGQGLGAQLCSELQLLLALQVVEFQYEDAYVQTIVQDFLVDLVAQIKKGGAELVLHLQDMDSQASVLMARILEASASLSCGTLLPDAADLEKSRMTNTLDLMKLLRAKLDLATSRGDALMALVDSKRVSFDNFILQIRADYDQFMAQERDRGIDAKDKQQAWAILIARTNKEHCDKLAALESKELTLQRMQQTGSLEQYLACAIVVEEARVDLSWAATCMDELSCLAAQNVKALQEQEQFAVKSEIRWKQGRQFIDEFSQWLHRLYKGIDVKAEDTFMACQRELHTNTSKFQQLQVSAQSDVQRRLQLTHNALRATEHQASLLGYELVRLQRSGAVTVDRFLETREKHETLLIDVGVLKSQLLDLRKEEEALQEWTPLQILAIGKDERNTAIDEPHTLQDSWVETIFFTKTRMPFLVPHVELHGSFPAPEIYATGTLAEKTLLATSVQSNTLPGPASFVPQPSHADDVESFTFVESEGGTGHMTMSDPVEMPLHQCLLPASELLTPNGPVAVSELKLGTPLIAHTGNIVHVKALRSMPERERDLVIIKQDRLYAEVTSSHVVARGPGGDTVRAGEIRGTFPLMMAVGKFEPQGCGAPTGFQNNPPMASDLEVFSIEIKVQNTVVSTAVVEVELTNASDGVLLCMEMHEADTDPAPLIDSFLIVFSASPQKPVFAIAGSPGSCVTVTDKDPQDDGVSCRSDPRHNAMPVKRIIRTIRPSHDETCSAVCAYHFSGHCRNGPICTRCHDPSHYKDRTRAPTRRSSRKKHQRRAQPNIT